MSKSLGGSGYIFRVLKTHQTQKVYFQQYLNVYSHEPETCLEQNIFSCFKSAKKEYYLTNVTSRKGKISSEMHLGHAVNSMIRPLLSSVRN